jgi:lysozyme
LLFTLLFSLSCWSSWPTTTDSHTVYTEDCPITVEDSLLALSVKLLKSFEGLRLSPYTCPGGSLTVGYGHTRKVTGRVSPQQADSLLLSDFTKALNHTWILNPSLELGQRYALAMFLFNVSVHKLADTQTLSDVQKGNEPQLQKWVNAKGKKLRGLEKRRSIELQFWRDWRSLFHKEFVHLDKVIHA